jgi:hypothetical protein
MNTSISIADIADEAPPYHSGMSTDLPFLFLISDLTFTNNAV